MPSLAFRLLNVFTRDAEPLSGNPLCVFESGGDLETNSMQALARQFNLSETTFLLPTTVAQADARVRIFTPRYELPFAGHPTLGSAEVCRSLGLGGDSLHLQMSAGIIPVTAQGKVWTLLARLRGWRELTVASERLAAALGVSADDIGARPLWVDTGTEQLIVPLTSAAAVRRAVPRSDLFTALARPDGYSMAYVFAVESSSVLARFFFSQGQAMLEDPATGSAAANLGGWWLALARPRPCQLTVSQGDQIARPSMLSVRVDDSGSIAVSGEVIEIGRGSLAL